jgi:hypothetical protein
MTTAATVTKPIQTATKQPVLEARGATASPPYAYRFGSFTSTDVVLLQYVGHLQSENARLGRHLADEQTRHTAELVRRENELQAEKDAFMKSVSCTCDSFRLRAAAAETHAEQVEKENTSALSHERQLVERLRQEVSGIAEQRQKLQTLLQESETTVEVLRKKQLQHPARGVKSKSENAKEKERDAAGKKLQQELLNEKSLGDAMQATLADKEAQLAKAAGDLTDAENAAKRLAGEMIQVSHLPVIVDVMQLYLKVETDKMYKAGISGGLENFAKTALAFLRAHRAGALDELVNAAVSSRRDDIRKQIAQGYEAGRVFVLESLVPHLQQGGPPHDAYSVAAPSTSSRPRQPNLSLM